MAFHIQDPENPTTTYLLEVLIEESADATEGGGAFAWATARGAELLLTDKTFNRFCADHSFNLVVGVDAITNELALEVLQAYTSDIAGLTVDIFVHDYSGSLFHPKFCWFRKGKVGTLVSGSGNLTDGGMRGNWEAFSVSELDTAEVSTIESYWQDWKSRHATQLFPPDHEIAIERAKQNVGWSGVAAPKSKKKLAKPGEKTKSKKAALPKAPKAIELDALVAEIPKGSDRWNQANFDLKNYEDFFGAKVGTTRHMFFRHVNEDGNIDPTEVRPSVAVKSSNWRFELAAAAGLEYPKQGRPIGVFVREAVRNFRYQLLMPGDEGHDVIERFLQDNWSGPENRIKRVRVSVGSLQKLWPDSALWQVEDLVPED